MKYKIYIVLIQLLMIFIVSCTSTQRIDERSLGIEVPKHKKELRNLEIIGKINSTYNGRNQSAEFNLRIASEDSISLKVFGPFGILAGRLFSSAKEFKFLSPFENKAYIGEPNSDNLNSVVFIPLNFIELVRIIRNETPNLPDLYQFKQKLDDGILYSNSIENNYVEFCVVDPKSSDLIRYQRKLADGNLILDVFYKDFDAIGAYFLPMSINMIFKLVDSKVEIEVDSYNIISSFDENFNFNIPRSIKTITF